MYQTLEISTLAIALFWLDVKSQWDPDVPAGDIVILQTVQSLVQALIVSLDRPKTWPCTQIAVCRGGRLCRWLVSAFAAGVLSQSSWACRWPQQYCQLLEKNDVPANCSPLATAGKTRVTGFSWLDCPASRAPVRKDCGDFNMLWEPARNFIPTCLGASYPLTAW